jgi:hypothetical protein
MILKRKLKLRDARNNDLKKQITEELNNCKTEKLITEGI